jgi:hypothetical protein
MQKIEITAEKTNVGECAVSYDMGDTVQELVQQFGEEVVYSRARQSLIIAIQAYIRGQLEAGKQPEEIQEAVADWKPGVRRPAKTPEDRAREALQSMSAEQRQAFLKELKSKSN